MFGCFRERRERQGQRSTSDTSRSAMQAGMVSQWGVSWGNNKAGRILSQGGGGGKAKGK